MHVLMIFVLSFIGLAWWTVDFLGSKNSNKQLSQEPLWTGFVDELKAMSPYLTSEEQLNNYLADVREKIRDYETDYSFLVAFNSTVREMKERLKETS